MQNTETIHPNPIHDITLKDFINKTMEALNDCISSLKIAADVKDVTRILNEILYILMVFKKDFIATHEKNNFKSIKNGIDIVNKKGSNSEKEQIGIQDIHTDVLESHLNGEEILTYLQTPIKINFQKDCSDEERTDFEDKEHAVVDEYIDNLKDEYSMENEEEVVNDEDYNMDNENVDVNDENSNSMGDEEDNMNDEDYNNDEDDESNEAPVAINCQKRRKYAQDVCSICKMKSWDIVTHEKETHMKDGAFICIYCDFKSLKKNELVEHSEKVHPKYLYTCHYCHQCFSDVMVLQLHVTQEHAITIKPLICFICGKENLNKVYHRRHLIEQHNEAEIQCHLCNQVYKSVYTLKNHLTVQHAETREKFTCHVCGKVVSTKQSLRNHMEIHATSNEKIIPCPQCDRMFSSNSVLKKHIREHHGENKKYLCTQCDFQCKNIGVMKTHTALKHSDERPFQCDKCDLKFKIKYFLNKHIEMVHVGERNHICKICGKGFKLATHLRRHERIHSQSYEAFCEICNKGFVQKNNYKLHLRIHHPI